ncbi:helix-turn-helix domain-containing protein [Paenibacillus polymyxa]|jgi:SOS-response transcriptional repressor LexA|uniref:helix-turn-helix domain-containing protein n=1 Tax=Paenibacillus polymyxa TaxID=1406 RepID=UPI001580B62F|nr:S24 family peptidase [Paenibacillus polymyxa]MBY0024503.1 helix-turn-helix domain-containing protein [Paenibacillus polymyxa]MBY0058631.1 helix-turn-helix domain-containing protein [Paenibacillus polymyxa]MBY0071217.1 helix-turn-helix domain-containing protein [Paenibacillus polymyxa]MBY0083480.1 helix-turn-helix domain-containing protein [Paenibacillus polymyxa]MBZ6441670.1 helix-turn-helix domain-containing protein [Paenibacillus polymyxa]
MSEKTIGDIIKEKRLASGYKTKKDFADKSGISAATLTRIEKNVQLPLPNTLMQISRHLDGVTYGELMKAAGYLEGLEENHETFLANFMNENEELDNRIYALIDKVFLFTNVDKDLHREIVSLFVDPQTADLFSHATLDDIKSEYLRGDLNIEQKNDVINTLENMLNKYSPKLGEYLTLVKNAKPIPLIGSICAGDGIIAENNIEEYINYPFMKQKQPDYALRVKGDSMVNAGINDGDIVFMRRENWAEFNGQIVAVIVNGEEGILKRMKWSEGSAKFNLVPENDSYQSMEVTPNEFIVCGVYVGHFRQ